jgi:hypothetical protein
MCTMLISITCPEILVVLVDRIVLLYKGHGYNLLGGGGRAVLG